MNIKNAIILAIVVIMILLMIIFPGESYLAALKIGGGLVPAIASYLALNNGTIGTVGLMMLLLSMITCICVIYTKKTNKKSLI